MTALRAAVVGVGNMGRHHLRVLSATRGIELVGIVERDPHIAATYSKRFGVQAFSSVDRLPRLDLAVVAVPTDQHVPVALALMERGVSILVEKPLAGSVGDARALVEQARTQGVVLAVGHVERFNPVFPVVRELVTQPGLIQFERLSPFTARVRESVVFDLMIHDLDLACVLADGFPVRVQASGTRVFSDTFDIASAVLEFPNGCIASLTASRATHGKVRRIAVSQPDRYVVADALRQGVSIQREVKVEFADDERALYRQANIVEVPYLDRRGEPVALELD